MIVFKCAIAILTCGAGIEEGITLTANNSCIIVVYSFYNCFWVNATAVFTG